MKHTFYKIEKGVPIPGAGQNRKTKARLLIESLKPGESVLLPRTEIDPTGVHRIRKATGFKLTCLPVNGAARRIWRTK